MLQVQFIKENKDAVISGLKKRHIADIDQKINLLLELDELRRKAQVEADQVASDSNAVAKEVGELMKAGKKEEAEVVKAKTASLREQKDILKDKQKDLEDQIRGILLSIPNVPSTIVPEGKSDADNVVVSDHGFEVKLHAGAKPHWELIKDYDLIDFDLGNKITGAGFPVYKKQGARLQRALVNFFLNEAIAAGYDEVIPPFLVNEDSGYGTGQLPDKDGQMYFASADNLYLIPTAEVPVMNIYRDVILTEDQLPIKNVAHSPCFRREAGSWGAHVRGLNRLHQFEKVEIVQAVQPEKSAQALEDMKAHVANLLTKLKLPFRILNLCGGDLGVTASVTYDFEVYSAAQERWLEVSSVSNCETYQATRLKLRYKNAEKKNEFLHTLNGSALALPRILASILENYQDENGIRVPEVLIPFTGFSRIDR